jgi:hypothetical protein
VVYLSPLHTYLSHARDVSQANPALRGHGHRWSVTFGVALLVAIGFSAIWPFAVIAGMALGFWSACFGTQLGTLLGNYLSFILSERVDAIGPTRDLPASTIFKALFSLFNKRRLWVLSWPARFPCQECSST